MNIQSEHYLSPSGSPIKIQYQRCKVWHVICTRNLYAKTDAVQSLNSHQLPCLLWGEKLHFVLVNKTKRTLHQRYLLWGPTRTMKAITLLASKRYTDIVLSFLQFVLIFPHRGQKSFGSKKQTTSWGRHTGFVPFLLFSKAACGRRARYVWSTDSRRSQTLL